MGLQQIAHVAEVEEQEEEAREGDEAREAREVEEEGEEAREEARFALGKNTGICEAKGIPNAENAWYDHEGCAASAALIV